MAVSTNIINEEAAPSLLPIEKLIAIDRAKTSTSYVTAVATIPHTPPDARKVRVSMSFARNNLLKTRNKSTDMATPTKAVQMFTGTLRARDAPVVGEKRECVIALSRASCERTLYNNSGTFQGDFMESSTRQLALE